MKFLLTLRSLGYVVLATSIAGVSLIVKRILIIIIILISVLVWTIPILWHISRSSYNPIKSSILLLTISERRIWVVRVIIIITILAISVIIILVEVLILFLVKELLRGPINLVHIVIWVLRTIITLKILLDLSPSLAIVVSPIVPISVVIPPIP